MQTCGSVFGGNFRKWKVGAHSLSHHLSVNEGFREMNNPNNLNYLPFLVESLNTPELF